MVYVIIQIVATLTKRPTLGPIYLVLMIIGVLLALLIVYKVNELSTADWAQTLLTIGLVLVTAIYAFSTEKIAKATKEQAEASIKMAEEMKNQRILVSKPIIIQKAVYEKSQGKYLFSHFEIYNAGSGPAIEMEISLLDKEKNPFLSHRESFLIAGEKPFQPFRSSPSELSYFHGLNYYLISEYKSILFTTENPIWYQTILPFKTTEANEKGGFYLQAGELEFREVLEKDRIDAFNSRSKPK